MAETQAVEVWVCMPTLSLTSSGARRFPNHSTPHFFMYKMEVMLSDLATCRVVGWT